ncbi:TonB-dependent receptor [Grimontia marina]|uniref:Pesticin receptor n=1 Tax=Grimontia marina TaxID=646534 RepID=A0A128F7H2_9GAMM|nr:TonB-dependent receptor [Grimontia marina]CZF82430.1 Pesticin receptor precursor [Grimontia marina]
MPLTPFSPHLDNKHQKNTSLLSKKKAIQKSSILKKSLPIACLVMLPISHSSIAAEQDALEVITVTADKRSANKMDVPSSLSVQTDQDLKDAQITSIQELGQHIPNLHIFTWGGSRESNIFIRGIGPGLFTDPTVGFYVDGVNYTNNGMFDLDLIDIERIEVLRGPQGTLYGGNSLAGIINVVTNKPDNFTEGRVSFSADSLNERKLNATVYTPIIEDELFAGLSLAGIQSDGHIENVFDGSDYGKKDDLFARTSLRWIPSDSLEANFVIDYQRLRDDSYALGLAEFIKNNPEKINNDFKGIDNRDSVGISLAVTKNFDAFDFTSITGWRDWENKSSADQDANSNPLYVFHSKSDEKQKQLSQELRWNSTTSTELKWLGGLYAYTSEYRVIGKNNVDYTAFGYGGPYVDMSNVKKDNSGYAAFGQLDYNITPNITLTAGLRLDREKRKANINSNNQSTTSVVVNGTKDFDVWLPKAGASYSFTDGSLLYTSVSRGYRAGGFDHLYPSQEDPVYDEETSTNYEIGFKTTQLDNKLDLSAAIFLIDIKDQQVQQLIQSTNQVLTDNAGRGRSQGIEIEARYIPANNWFIELGGSFTNAEYKKYENCDLLGSAGNCDGKKMVNTPNVTANLAVQYKKPLTHSLDLFTRVDAMHIGKYYFNSLNTLKQDPYQLINAKLGIEASSWDAYFWVKNALDENYSTVEYDFGTGPTAEAADPRSFGMTLTAYY